MNIRSFDRLTHQAMQGLTRRNSLIALGVAGLAGAFKHVDAAGAASNHANKPCKKQKKQCIAIVSTVCPPNDDACLAVVQQCCAFAGKCDIAGFINCLPS